MAKKKTSTINPEMLDELLAGQGPATVLGSDGLLGELKKALAERMLNAEMDVHLDPPAEPTAHNEMTSRPHAPPCEPCYATASDPERSA